MKKVGKRQKHGMRHGMMAFGPKIRTGMKATGLRICIARMSMDISRRKEKEKVKERKDRKERKERKDRKERKERKDRKERKERKEKRERKEREEREEREERDEREERKERKEGKERKARKERKEGKERMERKERKERTARTMKVMESQVMKKAYRTMFKLQPRQLLLKDNKLNTLLERQVHQLMVSLQLLRLNQHVRIS